MWRKPRDEWSLLRRYNTRNEGLQQLSNLQMGFLSVISAGLAHFISVNVNGFGAIDPPLSTLGLDTRATQALL